MFNVIDVFSIEVPTGPTSLEIVSQLAKTWQQFVDMQHGGCLHFTVVNLHVDVIDVFIIVVAIVPPSVAMIG